jgi:parallel beta-helix repeat protein
VFSESGPPTSTQPTHQASHSFSHRFLSLFLLLLLLLTILQLPIILVHAPPPTVRQVPTTQYPTIQSAIDASKRGDIVQVSPGTYHEHLIVPIAELTIRGENRETTIIDADTTGTAISLEASGIKITGFTLQNGGFNIGIRTSAYGSHNITNNIIQNFIEGIHFSDTNSHIIIGNTFFNNSEYAVNLRISQSNQINRNTITESVFGLYLYDVDSTTIMQNTISNTSYGIYTVYSTQNTIKGNTLQQSSVGIQTQSSDHLTISDNIITDGMYALDLQITHYSQISNNTITQASYGLYLFSSNTNNIFGSPSLGNLITKNHWGLILYNSTANTIIDGNTIADNVWGLYITSHSNGNTIYHNNFISNVDQAYQDWDVTNTYWNPASEGNYWDNYPGYGPAEGLDYYPLSSPWPLRNLAITNVVVSEAAICPGDPVTINVTVKNFGVITENVKVTAHYNSTAIGTKTATLTASAQQILTFNWNTLGVEGGLYTISATVEPIPYIESNYADNTLADGTIQVGLTGDINGDRTVNNIDLQLLNQAYGFPPPGGNPDPDLNDDNIVDARDLSILGKNYGTTT